MRRSVVGVIVVVIVSVLATSVQALTPVKVLGGPEDQYYGHSNGDTLGWTQNSTSSPKFFNAWVMDEVTGNRTRLNPRGTEGFFGGFDPGVERAIFQLIDDGRSDIKLYDLASKEIKPAPQGVNTNDWEWSPRISTNFVFFTRSDRGSNATWLMLLNRGTGKVKQLVKVNDQKEFVQSESVGERYAAWEWWTGSTWKVQVYDSQTGNTKTVPGEGDLFRYAPALDEARERLYVVRSGNGCGKNVVILRYDLTNLRAEPTRMIALPGGIDVFDMSVAVREADARVDLMFSRAECAKDLYSDIYALRGVDTLTG